MRKSKKVSKLKKNSYFLRFLSYRKKQILNVWCRMRNQFPYINMEIFWKCQNFLEIIFTSYFYIFFFADHLASIYVYVSKNYVHALLFCVW